MQRQLEKVFKWVEEKFDNPDIIVRMYSDWSGSFIDGWDMKSDIILFAFEDIREVTKADVDNFDLEKWIREK